MLPSDIQVQAYRTMDEVIPLRDQIAALNLASRRPCAFSSFEYIRSLALHEEYARPGDQLLFLCAFRDGGLVGYLPLISSDAKILGLPTRRIGLLVWHDTDRPHVVARTADEEACCQAFYRYLVEREPWALLELVYQDAESKLWPPPRLPAGRYYVRRFENLPNTSIPLTAATLADFFRSLPGDFRNTVARMSRRALRAGNVEAISCSSPMARRPLLDLYLDLERRSWKVPAGAGITRHPERLAFFRSLCEEDQELHLAFDFILLDGVPIAGMISGVFQDLFYAFETAYDGAYADLSPGYLGWLLSIRQGIRLGLRSYNLQSAYSYYKERWNGVSTPTWAVQVYRVPSLPYLKAKAGEWKRRLRGTRDDERNFNEAKRAVEPKTSGGAESRPSREPEAQLAARILGELEDAGAALERLSGHSLRAALPFDPGGDPSTKAGRMAPSRPAGAGSREGG